LQTGSRGRGGPVDRDPRNLSPEGAAPPEHRLARGRHDGGEQVSSRSSLPSLTPLFQTVPHFRILVDGLEEIPGQDRAQHLHGPEIGEELPLPNQRSDSLLPPETCPAPRHEAAKPVDHARRDHQSGRFRPGPRVWGPRPGVHPRGGHAVVPGPGGAAGLVAVLVPHRYLVAGVHLRRDGDEAAAVPGRLGNRPVVQDIPVKLGDLGRGVAQESVLGF
jgi:hypothetical protein